MDSMKRHRSANYTSEEVNVLLSIIVQFQLIIENKKTDAITWRDKEAAWQKIADLFNSSSPAGVFRNKESLKKAYENQKRQARKTATNHRTQLLKTGEGYKGNKPEDKNLSLTLSLINKKTVYGLENDFDSDAPAIASASASEEIYDVLEHDNIEIVNETAGSTSGPSQGEQKESRGYNDIDIMNETAGGSNLEEVNWGNHKAADLRTPLSNGLQVAASVNKRWSARRRPVASTLSSTNLTSKYDELASIKIECARLQLELLQEQKKESQLRQRSLELDIKIKLKQLNES